MLRVTIHWTETAKKSLAELPKKVRKGIFDKIGELSDSDPRKAGKALVGPFLGCRRLTYGRYRAIFRVEESKVGGKLVLKVHVTVLATGIRKEHDKKDVYKIAMKLIELGIVPSRQDSEDDEGESR